MTTEDDVALQVEKDKQENIRARRYLTWVTLATGIAFPVILHFVPGAAGATGAFYQLIGQLITGLLGAQL